MSIPVGIFMVLHGLVHLLYLGQGIKKFELKEGLTWPENAWAFSSFLNTNAIQQIAAVGLAIAAAGFIVSGVSLVAHKSWWHVAAISTTIFSTLLYILLWDGNTKQLADKGGVGILINLVLLAGILILK